MYVRMNVCMHVMYVVYVRMYACYVCSICTYVCMLYMYGCMYACNVLCKYLRINVKYELYVYM
jgi:hypothetical protein